MLSTENIPPPIPASRLLDDSDESDSEESDEDNESVSTNEIMRYTLEDVDLERYKRLILAEKYMLKRFNEYDIGYDDLIPAIKFYNNNKKMQNNINTRYTIKDVNRLERDYNVLHYDIKSIKIKNKSKKIKKEINNYKEKAKKIDNELKQLENDFYKLYGKSIINCKKNNCKNKCSKDVSYCLEHYPELCNKCDWICDSNNKYDKLTTNKFFNMYKLCQKCTKSKFLEYYRNNYKKDKMFRYVKDEKSMESILSQINYQEFINSSNIYNKLKELKEEQKMSDSDFKNYLCSKDILTNILDIAEEKLEENLSFKWQLYRQLSRTDDLIKTFGDKLKYIRFSNIRFRRMGYIQFQAFKEYLFELIYGEDYLNNEKFYNDIFDELGETDTSFSDNCCGICGINGILPDKELCLNCEYLTIK